MAVARRTVPDSLSARGLSSLVLLSVLLGCSPPERLRACPSLVNSYFLRQENYDTREFTSKSLPDQYTIFICGQQYMHPPHLELSEALAMQGAAAAPFLMQKLEESDDEVTSKDIILVFSLMSLRGSYEVAGELDALGVNFVILRGEEFDHINRRHNPNAQNVAGKWYPQYLTSGEVFYNSIVIPALNTPWPRAAVEEKYGGRVIEYVVEFPMNIGTTGTSGGRPDLPTPWAVFWLWKAPLGIYFISSGYPIR